MHKRIPQFSVFLLVLQGIITYLHWFVCETIITLWNIENPAAVLTLKVIFIGLSFVFVLSTMLAAKYSNLPIRIFYRSAMVWMGFFFYLAIASFASWLTFDLTALSAAQTLMVVYFGVASLVAAYGVKNANRIRVTDLSVSLPHLPESWKKRTAVFMSDLHLGQIRTERFAARAVKAVNDLHPDIVLIGGDLYDGIAADIRKVSAPLADLKAPLGVWFVMGNHDEFRNVEEYLAELKLVGFRVLMDEMREIDGLQLVGVDYRSTELKKQYEEVFAGIAIDRAKPSILLRHVPNFLKVARDRGVSLQLSGHTHDGQVFPLNFLTSWIFKGYGNGFKKKGDLAVYVSSGVGSWGPPLRVGTKSEVVKIKFSG
ncbi:MAG TPA: metallophosphoesterase [Candidatus Paceibacterota bacterium]|nr:metallophosphoesterase [Candidatus Paceibacterota bacterium]